MTRIKVFIILFFLTGCVENIINISIFDNGKYIVKYTSIGDKTDLLNIDFKHPESNNNHKWVSSLKKNNNSNDIWEKETILSSPTHQKLIFTNSSSLQYDIDIRKNSFFLWTNYYFSSNIKNLEIDKKYPEIDQYLDIDQEELEWMIPVKQYIFSKSIEKYQNKYIIEKLTIERINNQISNYISYIKEKKLENEFNNNAEKIFLDALEPIKNRLPNNFFNDINIIINELEREFEKNTALMSDNFTFTVLLPGTIKDSNTNILNIDDSSSVYWEFDFNDIAKNHFNMYAHSIVINNLAIQSFLLIIGLVFAGLIWKKRLEKE